MQKIGAAIGLAVALACGAASAQAGEIFTTNGVAIQGYDPVSYFTEGKPVPGQPGITAEWKGATFRFASEAHRASFVADPRHYAPQYGGFCAYGLSQGYKAPTEPQAFTIVGDKLYLNYDDEVQQTWRADVAGFVKQADHNWPDVQVTPDP